uniref:VirE protein n=1 Tax=Bacteroides togonis TaxID=1917883 RepID=UPI000ABD883C
AVKDLARCSFLVPREYVLYLDEERLFGNEELRIKNEEWPADGENSSFGGEADILHSSLPKFKGVPYSQIIQQWFKLAGGEPVQGERNDKLHRLASHLRYIADNDEALLLQVMPRYGLSEEEMRGLIHSACSAKWYSMPKMMRQAIENEERKMKNEELPADDENFSFGGEADILHSSLPKRLPALIKLLVSRTPDVYKPAVAHAVFPALGVHLHKVRFRYIDNVEHEATLMNVLMAGTGAGKDCISEPINRIMADIRRRDEDNLRREREWKNEVTSKGANKDKRQRPEGLIIQEIDADMTNPAFVMRMAEADGHFLYTKLNEIDQFDALRGSGRGGQQFQIMCLAFDPGNRYGQTRVGAQSVTEKVTIRFNWNASTTIQKGRRYFSKVLTDGPISRINFCTIPEREIGADMPVYGTYDAAFDEELRPYIENLVKAQGLIDCPQAYKLAQKLKEECADFARLSQSRVYENLSFRANVIAYLKACVLYVANGCRWDKTFEDFIRWSLQYDLACKMEFFGDAIEAAMNMPAPDPHKPGRRNLLTLLPDDFSFDQAMRVRQEAGLDAKGTSHMLSQWKLRGYITIITNHNYRKLKYRSDGIDLDTNRKD